MMFRTSLLCAVLATTLPAAHAAVSLTLTTDPSGLFQSFEYTQDFDSLSSVNSTTANRAWTNDKTLPGWSLFNGQKAALTYYRASAGGESSGYVYSFGLDGNTDRALGSVATGGTYLGSPAENAISSYMALALRNDSGAALSGITVLWDAEQWRVGENNQSTDTMDFRIGYGDSFASVQNWINPGSDFKYNTAIRNTASTAGYANDGNLNGIVYMGGDIATNWQPGQTLWLTWIDYNSAGYDHGVAIDNLFVSTAVSAVPEPAALSMLLGGLGVLSILVWRRRAVVRVA
ncbi:PEP-CTERM sorting domain-containing protein [Uliginosibacterium sp. H3]|uniref:PEP-CTERM sorting domain-containing protein n=1 Tax=Uliginosibacterium silvisoli TaxID=3114758 RepID=A0ABU6K5K1_9RHOO|nr:PEP-CTERM sorting domain-containing protein [Uliginosibacterium sp. H3]